MGALKVAQQDVNHAEGIEEQVTPTKTLKRSYKFGKSNHEQVTKTLGKGHDAGGV